ncbi:hypothetical protein KKB44_01455 [Candidatus Micrarchaeota archaeon]|nr:hypothetical protein [Candidatus Micrarchaeota archaeon]
MGRSVFILRSPKEGQNKAQFRKLQDELGAYSLKLEGPCSDKNGAVAELIEGVRERMRCIAHPVGATLATLTPRNMPSSEASWLREPFLIVQDGIDELTAGSIACSNSIDYQGDSVKPVNVEQLTLVGLSVLRRLGIDSFYSYVHIDSNHPVVLAVKQLSGFNVHTSTPCIFLPGENPYLVSFFPLRIMPYPSLSRGFPLEVLDDDAVFSLLKIKQAHRAARSLIGDVKANSVELQNEGELRAMVIGHLLFEGASSWTMVEAKYGIKILDALFGSDHKDLRSVREKVDETQVHDLVCPISHSTMAAREILCATLKQQLLDTFSQAEITLDNLKKLAERLPNHACIGKLFTYLHFANIMQEHIHPKQACKDLPTIN